MVQIQNTGTNLASQQKTQAETERVAGIIHQHLAQHQITGLTPIAPVNRTAILPFHSDVLPVNKTVLASLFPKYLEPSPERVAELHIYASAKENYGTAPAEGAAFVEALVTAVDPETAFVIGTARGRIEQLIAQRSSKVEIVTLDLPTELVDSAVGKPDSNNIRYRKNIGVTDDSAIGSIFKNDPALAGRVHQILGDSYVFEPGKLAGTMRMIVIDANHALANCLMDLATGLELAHPKGAVILADDFKKASPLNIGVEAAVVNFSVLTGLPILYPVPRPGEQGLTVPAALIVIPEDFDRKGAADKVRALARMFLPTP